MSHGHRCSVQARSNNSIVQDHTSKDQQVWKALTESVGDQGLHHHCWTKKCMSGALLMKTAMDAENDFADATLLAGANKPRT
eukprot:3057785-Amphidinium_carterae.1